jgi:rod shape-determining protein MreD
MRRLLMSAVLLAGSVLLQLTAINGLRLPGGGVPDLVLVVVAALGLASGPASGAIAGFAAGLALDLAPPGSGIIGEYALVFVLVGWACGRLRGTLSRSAVLPIIIVAAAAAAAELLVAGLSVALQSGQVSWSAIRQLLPAGMGYDLAISPFVLYLVLLAGAWLGESSPARPAMSPLGRVLAAGPPGSAARLHPGPAGRRGLAGTLAGGAPGSGGPGSDVVLLGVGGWLSGPPEGRRARRAAARRAPRLRPGSGQPADGWIGGSAASRAVSSSALQRSAIRGRAFRGAGGALHGQAPAGPAPSGQAPAGEALRGQAFRGATISRRVGRYGRRAGRYGRRAPGVPRLRGGTAGSAAPGPVRRPRTAPPVRLRLGRRRAGGFRPPAMPGGSTAYRSSGTQPGPASSVRLRPSGHGRDGVIGGGALSRPARPARPGRSTRPGRSARPRRPGGSIRSASSALGAGRAAAPRFRTPPGSGPAGGTRRPATPRFRSRPLGGTVLMNGKRPRFSRRRWRVLAVLTRRPGRRPAVWRVSGRRPG